MSSEEAEKVANPSTQEDTKESEGQKDEQENTESEDGTEVSKIVEAQTVHEADAVEVETSEAGEDAGDVAEAEEPAEESEKPRKLTLDDIKTAPMDFRFPTTNQAKHCFTRYVEYHKCVRAKGEDNPDCDKYARYYRSLCPGEWIDKWNEQRENGTFPGPL